MYKQTNKRTTTTKQAAKPGMLAFGGAVRRRKGLSWSEKERVKGSEFDQNASHTDTKML